MDLYANHLDTVETHLLQEIAARSNHFFEAAGIVQDLRGTLTRTYQQVAGLREQVLAALPFAECTQRSLQPCEPPRLR